MSAAVLYNLPSLFPTVAPSFPSSFRCSRCSRTDAVRVGVARQPPGSHDPSFQQVVPSFRLEPVEPAEEHDHLARQHHLMSASSFYAPSLSLLGPGALHRLGPVVRASGVKKALIITDTSSHRHLVPIVQTVQRELFAAGVDCSMFDEVGPNPTTQHVQAALLMVKEVGADSLVSVGGGSTHDAAKAVRALYGNTQQSEVAEIEGVDELAENPILKHFAVSTASGSSSELTRLAIITDPIKHVKMSIVDQRITPMVACNDTTLMMSQPPELIAGSGLQALAHAMEAFLSTASTPVTDAAALHAIRLISTCLRRAVQSPEDEKARDMLTYAEFLAGLSFNSAGLGLTHAMSNQLCALYINLPFSECSSIILPHVLQYYSEKNMDGGFEVAELFVDLAAALGCPAATSPSAAIPAVVCSVARLACDVELPETLSELNAMRKAGMKKDDIPEVAAKALTDLSVITAPCDPKLGEVESLFCRAWDTAMTGAASLEVGSNAPANATKLKKAADPEIPKKVAARGKSKKKISWTMRYNQLGKPSEYVDFNDAAAMSEDPFDVESYEE